MCKDHIKADADIPFNKPIIVNLMLSIEFILQRLADGWRKEMLINNCLNLYYKTL